LKKCSKFKPKNRKEKRKYKTTKNWKTIKPTGKPPRKSEKTVNKQEAGRKPPLMGRRTVRAAACVQCAIHRISRKMARNKNNSTEKKS
jgi:hypothetical protein